MKHYDFEEERVKQEIPRLGAKRVLIQLPEGLKTESLSIAKTLEKLGVEPIVCADPCYGACDLATAEAESLDADLIIHYGHSKLLKYERVPTIYVEARATLNVSSAVTEALPRLKNWQRIGLTTTIQHVQTLDEAKEILLHARKIVLIGDAGRLNHPGQVIGCDYSNAKSIAKDVDAFLFVGGGKFHALGVALSTSRPTVVADPYENRAYSVDKEAERIKKQRWASIQEAEKAKNFAVLVGLKQGQRKLDEALSVKNKLERKGKTAYVLAIREITPETLMAFPTIDAYVNTACPRISLDDALRFPKPVLTIKEVLVVVGGLSWETLCKEGLFGN
jgi:2-(3-amino-3-carboxypropyl)histidine synthase